jgi:hypothetical protein
MTEPSYEAKTQGDEYERFLEDMGDRLDRAGNRRASQLRRRRRIATGSLALFVVVSGIFLVIGNGAGRVDVVAQAAAALAPTDQILRIVTTSHLEMRGGTHPEVTGSEAESIGWNKPRTAEQWSASAPVRWRIATTIPTSTAAGSVTAAPIQCAYSNGSEETYNQAFQGNELIIVPVSKGQDESSQESSCTTQVPGGLGTRPVAHIHSMLEAGQLKLVGKGTVNGREVLRLTGHETRLQPRNAGSGAAWPVEYAVDPATYAPVRFTVEMVGANALGNAGTLTEITDVTTYEQLPLDETTTALLSIKTAGNPVIRHDLNQYEKRLGAEGVGAESASRAAKVAQSRRRHAGDRPAHAKEASGRAR